jgi:hypothetical protein
MKYFPGIAILAFAMFVSCRTHKNEILGIDSMKLVMWDMIKADELYIRILAKDSTARKRKDNIRLYEEVFALHHTTKGQFDSSYKYYEAHPVSFRLLIDSVDACSNREKTKMFNTHSLPRPPIHTFAK